MAPVVAALTMSLDGYVAHSDDSVGYLFDCTTPDPTT
jgi:hypothetical protein